MNILFSLAATVAILVATGCSSDATVASRNLSKAADMFEINRRIVFYNGITNDYMLVIEGRCSIEPVSGRLEVVCKDGPASFKKHFLGLSDNVTYIAEQTVPASVDTFHYRVIFKPAALVPDIDLVTK